MRGIMIYSNEITSSNAQETIQRLHDLQFTDIFYIAKNIDGKVFYTSKIAETPEDRLSLLCRLASEYKMGIYAWFCTFTEGYKGKLYGDGTSCFLQSNRECAVVNRDGKSSLEKPILSDQGFENYVCPANLKVQEHELDLIKEIAANNPVKGIHLDFIRYPFSAQYCYCKYCHRKFREDFGFSLHDEKASMYVLGWRQNIIADFVNKAHKAVRELNEAIQLSALVWKYDDCLDKTQDWKQWDIDFATPMFYHKSYRRGIRWVEQEIGKNTQISGKDIVAAVGGPYSNLFTKKEWELIERSVNRSQCKGIMYGHYGLLDVIQTLEGESGLADIRKAITWNGRRALGRVVPNVVKRVLRRWIK